MELEYIILIILILVLVWLNFIASLAIKYDHTLEKIQIIGQSVIVWLVPFFGAVIVLKIVFEHSPEAIPKSWIPWPFKKIVFGVPIKNRGGEGGVEVDSPGSRFGSNRNHDNDSGGGGGGGD